MASRAARLIELLDLLRRQRGAIGGPAIAQTLGVSLRTIYRDIDTLREQGADIAGDPGVGYAMRPGYLLPALSFGTDELEALVLGMRWVGAQADPELAEAASTALARIAGSLPAPVRLSIDTSGLFAPRASRGALPEPWLGALRRAIREERVIRMTYVDREGQLTERLVWPFAMAFFDPDVRMFAAWCELRGDFRSFRASSVRTLDDAGHVYPTRRHLLISRWRQLMEARPGARATQDCSAGDN